MNGSRILIVEDNAVNLRLATVVLEDAGFQILAARDANDALKIIRETPPDLILMDLGLPGMDGLALTRILKSDEATRRIPIVALTASAMRGDDMKAKAAGCDGYITKPVDIQEFPRTVAAILKSAAPGEASAAGP